MSKEIVGIAAVIWLVGRLRQKSSRFFSMIFFGFFCGAFLLFLSQKEVEIKPGKEVGVISGKIKEVGVGKTQVIRLSPFSVDRSPRKGSLLLYGETRDLLPGNQIEVETSIQTYEKPRNPGQFDLNTYYRCRGIFYSGFFDAEKLKIKDDSCDIFLTFLYHKKKQWIEVCQNSLPKEDAGILSAVLLGEKSYLDSNLKEQYQENGIAHILAISGLHISLIGGSFYHLLRKLGISFFPCGIASFLLMFPYCLMIGNAVSAVRATIMLLLFIGADIKGRKYDFLTSVSLAGLLILFESPYYLFDASFLLSFAAIFAIAGFYPSFKEIKRGQGLWLSLSVWLVLLPIQLWFFYECSFASLFLNFLVIPLMPALLFCGLVGIFTEFSPAFLCCHWILKFYKSLLVFPSIITGKPLTVFLILYLIFLIFSAFLIRKKSYFQGSLCILMGLFILSFNYNRGFSLTCLDVGQGDCIYVQSPGGTHYMIDGGSSDVSKVGKYRILPYLKYRGVKKLDYVVITHFDEDHYNGILELLESGYFIQNIIVYDGINEEEEGYRKIREFEKRGKIHILLMKEGDEIKEDGLSLRCLFPGEGYEAEKNQQSLVFLLKYKNFKALLTGDLEKEGELDFASKALPEVDLLKVGHHGSKNASQEDLLEKIRPKFSVVSCGVENRYGHPHEVTLERLKQYGSKIFITAQKGAVTIREKGGKLRLSSIL